MVLGRFLEGFGYGVWKVSGNMVGRFLEYLWEVFGRSLIGVWHVFDMFLEGVWKVFRKVFGRSLESLWKA